MIVKATVGAIITNEKNEILLIKRGKYGKFQGYWGLPGGHIDYGEKAEHAVIREIKEETGLELKHVKFIFYYDEINPEQDWHAAALCFIGKAEGNFKIDNDEIIDIKYFPLDEIKNMELAFRHKEMIFKHLKEDDKND